MKRILLEPGSVYAGSLLLVNEAYPYYEQENKRSLVPVNDRETAVLLDSDAVRQLTTLMNELDGWKQIAAVSGWRSLAGQQRIFAESLKEHGISFTRRFVALPGHSEHQTGLAVDLALMQDSIDFICPEFPYTGICQTFRERAVSYGFIERYPKDKERVTGIGHEPWHFRYVGTPHAEIMKWYGFTLEEYMEFLKERQYGTKDYLWVQKHLNITVSYLKARKNGTVLEIDEQNAFTVSGNNADGFIITQWRQTDGSA